VLLAAVDQHAIAGAQLARAPAVLEPELADAQMHQVKDGLVAPRDGFARARHPLRRRPHEVEDRRSEGTLLEARAEGFAARTLDVELEHGAADRVGPVRERIARAHVLRRPAPDDVRIVFASD